MRLGDEVMSKSDDQGQSEGDGMIRVMSEGDD